MSIRLQNGIPLLHFKCETSVAAIWFVKCGDCLDSYFGPVGLSHMLEHIYVRSDDEFYTNGATFSSSVSFIAVNNKKIKPITKLYQFLNSWFFDDNKLKDLIANHNIEDRVEELNRETGLKDLQYGKSIAIAESLKTNKASVFSQFETSFSTDDIKQSLYRILDYMLDPSRIIIAIGGKSDTRAQAAEIFNPTFGALKPSKVKITASSHHLSSHFNGLKNDDVLFLNFPHQETTESAIIVPVKKNSFLLTHPSSLYYLHTTDGDLVSFNTLFDIIDGEYNFFLEIRLTHRSPQNQLKYRDGFSEDLPRLAPSVIKDRSLTLDEFIMRTPKYGAGLHEVLDFSTPEKAWYIFIVNTPDRTSRFLTKKSIPFHRAEKAIRKESLSLERLQRFERPCFSGLRKDLESTKKDRENYHVLYFPMSYECVLAALLLQARYPRSIYVEHNMIMTPYETVFNYLRAGTQVISDEIEKSSMPNFIMNLETYCIFENVLDSSVAAMHLMYGSRILNLTTSLYPIYYKPPRLTLDNDLFIFEYPFNFFVHVVKGDPGSYTDIIRRTYKQSGLIYYGEMQYYDNHTIIRGIMN